MLAPGSLVSRGQNVKLAPFAFPPLSTAYPPEIFIITDTNEETNAETNTLQIQIQIEKKIEEKQIQKQIQIQTH